MIASGLRCDCAIAFFQLHCSGEGNGRLAAVECEKKPSVQNMALSALGREQFSEIVSRLSAATKGFLLVWTALRTAEP